MTCSISIITVVRNGERTIRTCLASVRAQTLPVEHVVVDGQSTDGTLAIVAAEQNPRLSVSSEPDQGIYDAMRKGIARAQGEIIGILNADDFYANSRVIERVSQVFSDPEADSCYGDLVYVQAVPGDGLGPELDQRDGQFQLRDERVVRRWRAGPMSGRAFHWGWMPPHPTFFVRRSVYERYGVFRLDVGTAADYELMLRFLVKHGVTTRYIPEVLVKMRAGGVSNASLGKRLLANRNDRKAWAVNGLTPYPWTLWMKPLRKVGQWVG